MENNLHAKMARIMGRLERLPKTGTNKHFNYKFVTDSDVSDTIRAELAAENIGFYASMTHHDREGVHTQVEMEYTFACGDTGETFTCHWRGEANDKQDKGITKAVTSATKYFLMKTFVLSTGDKTDDPDGGGAEEAPAPKRKSTPRQSKPAARKPNERRATKQTPARKTRSRRTKPEPEPVSEDEDNFLTIAEVWDFDEEELTTPMTEALEIGSARLFAPMKPNDLGFYPDEFMAAQDLGTTNVTEYPGTVEDYLNAVLDYHQEKLLNA
jgi:hypothetical protein